MNISFEFFPPKTERGAVKLVHTAKDLAAERPNFFSVTFGAGGSTQDTTLQTVANLQQDSSTPVVPHISCIGMSCERISNLLDQYRQLGVRRLVVLRGDLPSGSGSMAGDFSYARDLVAFIRQKTGDFFHITVAAYPECHPGAASFEHDVHYFKDKIDAGADLAITQYFFNADAYYQFMEDCARLGVTKPVIPGIMPIVNFTKLARFSDACGADIPRHMRRRLEGFGDDAEAVYHYGLEIVGRLMEQLLALGAPGFHFYTLNQAQASKDLLQQIRGN